MTDRGAETIDGCGYAFDYIGFGLRCPECEFIGTYQTCQNCGYVMEP